jgi:hypothetical protein
MAVHTSKFGGVRLSGEDAKKFSSQVTYGRPKKAACEALREGNKLLNEYRGKGFATVTVRDR